MTGETSSASENTDGRRIYIHRYAFRWLIVQRPAVGERICNVLAQVRAAKLIHHHLVDIGGMLGLVRPAIAEEFAELFQWKEELSSLLCELAYRPSFPRDRGVAMPVLGSDECVVATCEEAGYYTFATGEEASERMFADRIPMSDLQRSLAAGHGPVDLTIIKGRSLVVIDPEIGVGQVGHRYSVALASNVTDSGHADKIDAACRSSCLLRVQGVAHSMLSRISDDERQALDELMASLRRSFEVLNSI